MIDMEAASRHPLLFELAPLVDDYPFAALDAQGWDQRMDICGAYLSSLEDFGLEHHLESIDHRPLYEPFMLHRAVVGLKRLRHPRAESSSALRHERERVRSLRACDSSFGFGSCSGADPASSAHDRPTRPGCKRFAPRLGVSP